MKKDKIVPFAISIALTILIIVGAFALLTNKGKEKYDVVIFGDSIIAGIYNHSTIPAFVEEYGGYKTLNAGFGGLGMSNVATSWLISDASRLFSMAELSESVRINDFSNQLMSIQKDNPAFPEGWYEAVTSLQSIDWGSVKYIIIEQGANDYLSGMPLEDENDKYNVNAFGGALRTSIRNIKKGAPDATLIIATPIYQKAFEDIDDCHTHSFGGGTLDEYVEKEMEIAKDYDVYVVDNFHEVDINESNYKDYLPGGLHPDVSGNELIAGNIVRHLEELDENS